MFGFMVIGVDGGAVCALIGFALLIALGVRLVAGSMDHERIREEVRKLDGEVIDLRWNPMGRGWFGEKGDRIYSLRYRDRAGAEFEASVKTSMLSGVYFADQRMIKPSPSEPAATNAVTPSDASELSTLAEENAKLRAEVERLRRERDGGGSPT